MRVRILSATIVLLLLAASSAALSLASTITVVGQDDVAVDRAAIQAALDSAEPRDTIELFGTFQLDGTWLIIKDSRLTVEGRAVDNDGDGRVNEDPVDGEDNDGDAAVDEDDWDAVLNGIADVDGSPMLDGSPATLFNRGLIVDAGGGTLRQLTVRNIKFSTFNRAISFAPQFAPSSNICEDLLAAPAGAVDGVTVEGNWVHNSFRGIQFFNDVRNLTVTGNFVTGAEQNGVLIVGEVQGCTWANGDDGSVPIATPTGGRISGNAIIGNPPAGGNAIGRGVNVSGGRQITVDTNWINEHRHGVRVYGGSGIHVHHNRISEMYRHGLLGVGETAQTFFANNTVRDALRGVGLYEGSGFRVVNNDTLASEADVFLDADSFENMVIATDFFTQVVDLGTDNTLVGTLAMITNPGVSDDVRAKLEEIRARLAEKMQ